MSETLLQKAKSADVNARSNVKVTEEMMELAVAWAKDQVGSSQVQRAMGLKSITEIYRIMAVSLREAQRQGKIKVVQAKK